MTEFTPARLAELRAVAEGATPGPWQWMDGGVFHSTSFGWQPVTLPGESAQHIAAFDPPTVLSLIAALGSKTAEVESLAKEALHALPDNRLGTLSSYITTLEQERDEARAEVERLSRPGRIAEAVSKVTPCTCSAQRARAEAAEAALERVREAATEVTNQGNNNGRTHYNNCWKQHLHCLAAKIIHETEADDE